MMAVVLTPYLRQIAPNRPNLSNCGVAKPPAACQSRIVLGKWGPEPLNNVVRAPIEVFPFSVTI